MSGMARVTVFPNGVTASFPRRGVQANVAVRGKVNGWSIQSTRRLRRWLYSVDGPALVGAGLACTFTIRKLPPAAADWTRTHRAFFMRLRRAGLLRGQWLTEWQRRGVPHLHGCMFFPEGTEGLQELVTAHWLAAAAEWEPNAESQHVAPIWDLSGWLQYQAKHSARGVQHYQRANVPESWREGTGRLWGYLGDWPVREELIDVSTPTFHRFRRLMRGWQVSQARRDLWKAQDPREKLVDLENALRAERQALRRLLYLENILRCPDPKLSRVRAVGEFCPEPVARRMLAAAELR